MRAFANLLALVAVVAAGLGMVQVWQAFTALNASAPQQAAGVSFGIGIAVIPYCIASLFLRMAAIDVRTQRDTGEVKYGPTKLPGS